MKSFNNSLEQRKLRPLYSILIFLQVSFHSGKQSFVGYEMIKKPPGVNLLNQFFIIFSGLFNQCTQKLDVNRQQLLISARKCFLRINYLEKKFYGI